MKQELLKIMECIAEGNKELVKELEECISDTEKYYENHQEEFEERGMEDDEEEEDIQWIAMVDILEREGYVAECDWKEGKEDFLWHVSHLNGIKSKGLELDEKWFDEAGEIIEWLEILDEKWKAKKVCMAAVDISSDSYVIFPIAAAEFEMLEELAEEIGFRIALAKDM